MRPYDAFVPVFKLGMKIEDRLAGTLDEALRFAMGDRHVAADQVVRQLDDHSNPAQAAALDEGGAHLRSHFRLEFRHVWSRGETRGTEVTFRFPKKQERHCEIKRVRGHPRPRSHPPFPGRSAIRNSGLRSGPPREPTCNSTPRRRAPPRTG